MRALTRSIHVRVLGRVLPTGRTAPGTSVTGATGLHSARWAGAVAHVAGCGGISTPALAGSQSGAAARVPGARAMGAPLGAARHGAFGTHGTGFGLGGYGHSAYAALPARTSARAGTAAFSRLHPALAASASGRIVGIDLGTTNSCVSVMEGDTPIVIQNTEGKRTTPSVVYISKEGEIRVGETAKRMSVLNPESTMFASKRFIGRRYDDSAIRRDIDLVPYRVVPSENGDAWLEVHGKAYSPAQIGAMVLGAMRKTAETYLGHPCTEAVITVPAYFNDAQRQATRDAGKIAGLSVRRIINEPTAAALTLPAEEGEQTKRIVVFDLGGGTFDVSVLEIADGVYEVKATDGDTFLGGEDFDNVLIGHLISEFKQSSGVDLHGDLMAMQRLRTAVETAKRELDSLEEAQIREPFIAANAAGPVHLELTLTRSTFEHLTQHLVSRTVEKTRACLKEAGLGAGEVSQVVLVGGMTRTPCVQRAVTELFGRSPYRGVNPDEVVAMGAAIQGGTLSGHNPSLKVLLDVTPLSLGVETHGGLFHRQIPRNTSIPTTKTDRFTTVDDFQSKVLVRIAQGEREFYADNHHLGQFELDLSLQARSRSQIDVVFDIDEQGLVSVTAKDVNTGKSRAIRIQTSGGHSQADIDRMVHEAETHQEQDKKRRGLVETRNTATELGYKAEKMLEEGKGKGSSELADALRTALETLRERAKGDDDGAIKSAHEALMAAMRAFSEATTSAAAPSSEGSEPGPDAAPGPGSGPAPSGDQNVIEAQVVDDADPKSGKADKAGKGN